MPPFSTGLPPGSCVYCGRGPSLPQTWPVDHGYHYGQPGPHSLPPQSPYGSFGHPPEPRTITVVVPISSKAHTIVEAGRDGRYSAGIFGLAEPEGTMGVTLILPDDNFTFASLIRRPDGSLAQTFVVSQDSTFFKPVEETS